MAGKENSSQGYPGPESQVDREKPAYVLRGFGNPTTVYPSALVAFVEKDAGYAVVHPDGTEYPTTPEADLGEWEKKVHITLLNPELPLTLHGGELLFGVDEHTVVMSTPDVVRRNLLLRLGMKVDNTSTSKAISQFIDELKATY